jgi:hypothetical protein
MENKKPATSKQIQKICVMMNNIPGMIEHKDELILSFTSGRTSSRKEMYQHEALSLINYLSKEDPNVRMIKKVFAIGYSIGWLHGNSEADKRMNQATIERFVLSKGTVRKPLRNCNTKELVKLVSQFEKIQKHIEEASINKQLKEILTADFSLSRLRELLTEAIETEDYEKAANLRDQIKAQTS